MTAFYDYGSPLLVHSGIGKRMQVEPNVGFFRGVGSAAFHGFPYFMNSVSTFPVKVDMVLS